MKQISFELSAKNKQAFAFEVTSEGPLTVKVVWNDENQLEGFLFGPGSKVPYDRNLGSRNLSLSQNVSNFFITKGSKWVVQLYNPTDYNIKGTILVASPSQTEIKSQALHEQTIVGSKSVALLIYLIDRYANNIEKKTDIDKKIEEALDALPSGKSIANNMVCRWKNIPVERRKAIFGAEFGDIRFDKSIDQEYMRRNFVGQHQGKCTPILPGLRGLINRGVSPSRNMPPPMINRLPMSQTTEVRSGSLEPTYRIDYCGLYCQKETDWDQSSNSDEPYVVFVTTDGYKSWARVSGVYEDVDSGEARGPSPALLSLFGELSPEAARDISIISTVMEHDFGDPNYYKDEIHALVKAAQATALYYGIPIPDWVANLVADGINYLIDTGDDKIGTSAVVIERNSFYPLSLANSVTFKGLTYNLLCPGVHYGNEWWNEAKYWVMYNIRHDPLIPIYQWSEWENLGGILSSGAAASSWAEGRLDVFVEGTDNALYHRWFDGGWHDWESLGGNINSSPAAVSWGPNRIDVFARGVGGSVGESVLYTALWHKWFDGVWHDWEAIISNLIVSDEPAVSSWEEGRLDVFTRLTDLSLGHLWYDGSWHDCESLGGKLGGPPAAVSWGPGRIDVFARGGDNALWHIWYDESWHDWESLGGVLAPGKVAVSSWDNGRLDVFVRGADNALWTIWFDGSWHEWASLGGTLTSGPGAVSWAPNRIDIFVRDTGNSLSHLWWAQYMK